MGEAKLGGPTNCGPQLQPFGRRISWRLQVISPTSHAQTMQTRWCICTKRLARHRVCLFRCATGGRKPNVSFNRMSSAVRGRGCLMKRVFWSSLCIPPRRCRVRMLQAALPIGKDLWAKPNWVVRQIVDHSFNLLVGGYPGVCR